DFGDRPPQRSFSDRPPRKDFGDRPPSRSFGDRPPRKDFGDRPPKRTFGDRPPRKDFGDRPPKRSFSDRPPRKGPGGPEKPGGRSASVPDYFDALFSFPPLRKLMTERREAASDFRVWRSAESRALSVWLPAVSR